MSEITIVVPRFASAGRVFKPAERGRIASGARLTLVNNGRPRAVDLLERLGRRLQTVLPIESVEVYSKLSPAKPLDHDEISELATKSDLVVCGVGD